MVCLACAQQMLVDGQLLLDDRIPGKMLREVAGAFRDSRAEIARGDQPLDGLGDCARVIRRHDEAVLAIAQARECRGQRRRGRDLFGFRSSGDDRHGVGERRHERAMP